MQKIYAVILAAGKGLRMGEDKPKQLLPLSGKPIIAWSTLTFDKIDEISNILIVSPKNYINEIDSIMKTSKINKHLKTIIGGKERQDSVYNALTSQKFNDEDILLFHDAARPFIKKETISELIIETKKHGAAGVYVPAIDTITEIENGFIKSIPSRETMYNTQTPQSFKFQIIWEAHQKAKLNKNLIATDDVSLVIQNGGKVKLVQGDYSNIKITNKNDYDIAKHFAEN